MMDYRERGFLIFDDVLQHPQLQPVFAELAQQFLDGRAEIIRDKERYSRHFFHGADFDVIEGSLLDYYLWDLTQKTFSDAKARAFCEAYRKKFSWNMNSSLGYTVRQWVEQNIAKPYFVGKKHGQFSDVLKPDVSKAALTPDMLSFACYVAVCETKYGSYGELVRKEIFNWVEKLGCDLPAKLKKYGSGDLPKELAEYREGGVHGKANDAFATINLTIAEDSEENYALALDYVCRVLQADFPRSYSLGFRCPLKSVLPIKGLPKCGVHHLFANAIRFDALQEKIEAYARLAMRQFEWYNDLNDLDDGEHCAMPGTFAVFALGLRDLKYAPLLRDYLHSLDDEHQSIHEKFMAAYIGKYGFTPETLPIFVLCCDYIQELQPQKVYRESIANAASLQALLALKPERDFYDWERVLYALWGLDACQEGGTGGKKILSQAPEALKPLYAQALTPQPERPDTEDEED